MGNHKGITVKGQSRQSTNASPQAGDTDQIDSVEPPNDAERIESLTQTTADLLAQRFVAEWASHISAFTKVKQQPSFYDVSDALRRAADLNIISTHGVRAPLEFTSVYLRLPHPDEWPSDAIPLYLEERWLDDIFIHQWTSEQTFIDVFHSIATKLRKAYHWRGETSYDPDATFGQLADLLLYGLNAIRNGNGGLINQILQIVGNDWVITDWELVDKENHYQILLDRLDEDDWLEHVLEKTWVDSRNFVLAFGIARILIYKRIFDGKLPEGWSPPNIWPFKIVFPDGSALR